MAVILEKYTVTGTGEIEIRQPVELGISAREAQRRVNSWLCHNVTMMLNGGEPVLIVGETTRWQVPVIFTAPHVGSVGEAGRVTVDAQSGVIDKDPQNVESILREAQKLSKTVPPFKVREAPPEYLATNLQPTIPSASRLKIQPDGEIVIEAVPETD
ncbi:MAG: hypothetical protein R3A44_21020 [Caldilineaceae bacterium]